VLVSLSCSTVKRHLNNAVTEISRTPSTVSLTKIRRSLCAFPKIHSILNIIICVWSVGTYDATGVCGDPHFAAPGGIFFDWHGERDQDFSIISDTNFQVRLLLSVDLGQVSKEQGSSAFIISMTLVAGITKKGHTCCQMGKHASNPQKAVPNGKFLGAPLNVDIGPLEQNSGAC
jgi:hypothetical protein